MYGFFHVTGVGLIFVGAIIALFIEILKGSFPQLRRIFVHPIVSLFGGIIIAYILDDISSGFSTSDILAIVSFLITLIFFLIPFIQEWFKSRRENLKKIEECIHGIEIKLATIEGELNVLIHQPSKTKKKR